MAEGRSTSPAIRGDDLARVRACVDALLARGDEIRPEMAALQETIGNLRTKLLKRTGLDEEACNCQEPQAAHEVLVEGEELRRLNCAGISTSPAIHEDDLARVHACVAAVLTRGDEILAEMVALTEEINGRTELLKAAGLNEEAIAKRLKQHKYTSMEEEQCCICQEEYVEGEEMGRLDCGHHFHCSCIKQWLTHKNLCPICKNTALKLTK